MLSIRYTLGFWLQAWGSGACGCLCVVIVCIFVSDKLAVNISASDFNAVVFLSPILVKVAAGTRLRSTCVSFSSDHIVASAKEIHNIGASCRII